MPAARAPSPQLTGIKIAVTAIDLEQAEHRGIAYFTQNLIKSLHELGADVYLITALKCQRCTPSQLAKLPTATALSVQLADLVEQLESPPKSKPFNARSLESWIRTILWASKLLLRFWMQAGRVNAEQVLPVGNQLQARTQGSQRLSYVPWIAGFIQVPAIYALASLRSRGWLPRPPKLDLRPAGIHLMITTCPLNINAITAPGHSPRVLQVIHDCFALESAKHPDDPWQLCNRLRDAFNSDCLFVSEHTQTTVSALLEQPIHTSQAAILHQPPSLSTENLEAAALVPHMRGLGEPFVVFNASVVPRKNLLFLIQLFLGSSLPVAGVKLVVSGHLRGDAYGQAVRERCNGQSSIELWGYVNELEKAWLYLRALALASPSLLEGFGIPVLDGSCLGLPVLASDIPSHAEIAALLGHPPGLKLLPNNNNLAWLSALDGLNATGRGPSPAELEQRLRSYRQHQQQLSNGFQQQLASSIQRTTRPAKPR